MRVRIPIMRCLIVVACTAVAALGWHQDRPRHVVVKVALNSGYHSYADPNALIVWHHASLQMASGSVWVDIYAQARDIPGATIRCTLDGYPGAGGTKVLTGNSPPSTTANWSFIKIDRNTWIRSVLHLGEVPTYTLDYSTPRSHRWTALSIFALFAGPAVVAGSWVLAKLRSFSDHRRRGFQVLPTQGTRR
jgi:hypothetical protein